MRRLGYIAAGLLAAASFASGAADPSITRFGEAASAYDKKDFATVTRLLSATGQPVKLRDYVVYYLANAELMTNSGDSAVSRLASYVANPVPASPLAGRISLLYAKALLGQRSPTAESIATARRVLESDYRILPQPDGDLVFGQAMEATLNLLPAVRAYQRIYYSFPASEQAAKAKSALDRLRQTMSAADYPEATGRQRLDRAAAWLKARNYVRARQEYSVIADDLKDADREEAQVGVGAALYLSDSSAAAASYLATLHPQAAEPAAERLYYLTEIHRKLSDDASMMAAIDELAARYPQSPWRQKALITAGNRYLLLQDRVHYVPLYRAVAADFPASDVAPLSHWRVAWAAWVDGSASRVPLLRDQIEKFPGDTHMSDALFFLARAAEQAGNLSVARAYYGRLSTYFPHYYYGGLGREKLTDAKIAAAKEDPATVVWLRTAVDAPRSALILPDLVSAPNDATRQRIDRGRLLVLAGLTTEAVEELQYGAKQENEQPTLLAMELSRSMPEPYLAIRVMKKFAGDYLSLPFDRATRGFWEMLFPMPFRSDLTVSSTAHDLDPYAVAGLIRQESEFNPGAHSPANAYGLMQLIPSTGRLTGKKEGVRITSSKMLLQPSLNIQLGTGYLRGQLNNWDGDWVRTLAAYNAGPTRVRDWVAQYGYNDPAEFIQNIPFTETRDYVQAVLRNGQVYRELYGSKLALAEDAPDSSAVPAVQMKNAALVTKAVGSKTKRLPARRVAVKKPAAKTPAKPVTKKKASASKQPPA